MCFVIAGFLPGGKIIRNLLLPELLQVVQGRPISSGHQLDDLTTLMTLATLIHYSKMTFMFSLNVKSSSDKGLSFWPLKYQTEIYALRLNLYKSAQDLRGEVASSASQGIEKYQRYLFWLQIFGNSH
jgi:hypothetical protein